MAATMTRVKAQVAVRPAARTTVVVRASSQVDRRAILLGGLATVAGLLSAPQEAQAIRIASQEFTGGMLSGGGSSPKSGSGASQESYNMEGTKKTGISPKRKRKVLAKVKEQALKEAALGK